MASTCRRAAILAAEVAGYLRLMGANEEGRHERLKAARRQLVDPKIERTGYRRSAPCAKPPFFAGLRKAGVPEE